MVTCWVCGQNVESMNLHIGTHEQGVQQLERRIASLESDRDYSSVQWSDFDDLDSQIKTVKDQIDALSNSLASLQREVWDREDSLLETLSGEVNAAGDLPEDESTIQELALPSTFQGVFKDIFDEAFDLLVERQRKYGPKNVESLGLYGVFNRLSDDKVERIRRALNGKVEHGRVVLDTAVDFADESFEDALFDIANYALIMIALKRGEWGKPLAEETPIDDTRAVIDALNKNETDVYTTMAALGYTPEEVASIYPIGEALEDIFAPALEQNPWVKVADETVMDLGFTSGQLIAPWVPHTKGGCHAHPLGEDPERLLCGHWCDEPACPTAIRMATSAPLIAPDVAQLAADAREWERKAAKPCSSSPCCGGPNMTPHYGPCTWCETHAP